MREALCQGGLAGSRVTEYYCLCGMAYIRYYATPRRYKSLYLLI